MNIGVDIGNVVMGNAVGEEDTSFFGPNYLLTPAKPDAIPSLTRLVSLVGKESVYLVSKCGDGIQARTKTWLVHHKFFETTGMDPANLYFCYERKQKAGICERLDIDVFIDDKLDCLLPMIGKVEKLFLYNPSSKDLTRHGSIENNKSIKVITTWKEFMDEIVPYINQEAK